MTYKTLMVHADIGGKNEGLFHLAADMASHFDADIIGVAVCTFLPAMYFNDCLSMADLTMQDRLEIETEMKICEERFRAALHNRTRRVEWRSSITWGSATDYLVHQSRAADILLINPNGGGSKLDASRRVNMSDLVLQSGRPVLIAQTDPSSANLGNALVAWKDTREARQAIVNALPLLQKAYHVTVVEIAEEDDLPHAQEHVKDVVAWLSSHGVKAEPFAVAVFGEDAAHLDRIAKEKGAGLLVAGAYGHSRLREWTLGGVTRDLLLHSQRCSLVSH